MEWLSPTGIAEACRMLSTPGARLIAGCTAVQPRSLLRAEAEPLIDLSGLVGLQKISRDGDSIFIGAMVPIDTLASDQQLAADLPLLTHVARQIGDAVIRRQATIGGNLMARGGWEIPAALLALGAYLRIADASGERSADAADLCSSDGALAEGEILVGVEVAVQRDMPWSYRRATTNGGAYLCAIAGTRGSNGPNLFLAGGASHPMPLASVSALPSLRTDALASGAYRRRLASVLAAEARAEIVA